jgi:hypothetical protein
MSHEAPTQPCEVVAEVDRAISVFGRAVNSDVQSFPFHTTILRQTLNESLSHNLTLEKYSQHEFGIP